MLLGVVDQGTEFLTSELSLYFYSTPSAFTRLRDVVISIHEQYASTYVRKHHSYNQIRQSRAGPMAGAPPQTTFFMPNSSAIMTAAFSPMTSAVE